MKLFSMILLTIFLGKSCSNSTQNDISHASMHYNAHARGYYLDVTIADKKATISKSRNENDKPKVMSISETDWNELVGDFQKIDLEKLAEYKDPTQKRYYDGAPTAQLQVQYKDKNYESKFFDHGFPPKEIEKIVNKIVSLDKPTE